MTTNADRIAEWCAAHPTERLSVPVLLDTLGLTTLSGANLNGANLRGANLRGVNLPWANLRGVNLSWANLRGADLFGANLRGVNLRGVNLRGADLNRANLSWANLSRADLRGADLNRANLFGALHEHILPINAGASGMGALYPQAEGWRVAIGCWRHRSLDEFADLLADRIDWPEARGKERERRRPLLQAIYGMCLAFVDQMPADLIDRHAAAHAEEQS